MSIITTINIDTKTFEQIEEAALKMSISKSDIVKLLVKKFRDHNELINKFGVSIQYQKRDENRQWHRFHIRLLDHEYEYFLDLRRFCKISVAHMLQLAVESFLNDNLKEKSVDKNPFGNYLFVKNTFLGIVNWTIYWGFPTDVETHMPES